MEAVLSSEMTISGYSEDEARQIKASLVAENPTWVSAMSLGKSVWGIQPKLKFYREENGTLVVPVGYLDTLKDVNPNVVVTDNRFVTTPIDITFKGTLYDYQQLAVDEMAKHTNGVLSAITAAGKTVMACALIAKIKQPTLILVDTIELANQFTERLLQFTDAKEIGRIGTGQNIVKPITVGTLQTLARFTKAEIAGLPFGCVIVDEVHVVPAVTYAYTIGSIPAQVKYGLSATPERGDGLTRCIFWLTGPLRHLVPTSSVSSKIVKPTYETVATTYTYPLFDSTEYGQMITDMADNTERNKLIVDTVAKYPTQQCVLLCHRQEHVRKLVQALPGSVALLSSTKKKERAEIMKQLQSGKKRIVVTTWQLFHKGIDLSELEILFICAPTRSKVWLKQSAGRLMRLSKKIAKEPVIVDFIDKKIDLLRYQAYARKKVLTNL
jgi:superfamily II DNA or RNA helicase